MELPSEHSSELPSEHSSEQPWGQMLALPWANSSEILWVYSLGPTSETVSALLTAHSLESMLVDERVQMKAFSSVPPSEAPLAR